MPRVTTWQSSLRNIHLTGDMYIRIEEFLNCVFLLSDQETYKVEKRPQGYFEVEDNDNGEKDDQRQGQLLRQGKM